MFDKVIMGKDSNKTTMESLKEKNNNKEKMERKKRKRKSRRKRISRRKE